MYRLHTQEKSAFARKKNLNKLDNKDFTTPINSRDTQMTAFSPLLLRCSTSNPEYQHA